MSKKSAFVHISLVAIVAGSILGGCAVAEEPTRTVNRDGALQTRIINGTFASGYPEAALIDFKEGSGSYICSGALIAPRVVLTAGHCVDGASNWAVKLPFSGNQTAYAVGAAVYDYSGNTSEYVNPKQHDVGLIFLNKDLKLNTYPVIANAPLSNGSSIVNIGRIRNGKASYSGLYVSKELKITNGTSYGFPFDYITSEIIEPGDSGGPDIQVGSSPHKIVAVNSGSGGGTEVLARVDLVYNWIQSEIAKHGGSGATQPPEGNQPPAGNQPACAHSICSAGSHLNTSCGSCVTKICKADSYCCNNQWDAQCISEVSTICGQSCGGGSGGSTNTCSHSECAVGSPLEASCSACAGKICKADSFCCNNQWDAQCIGEVSSVCGMTCN